MSGSRFDRLSEFRRNRRFRNLTFGMAAFSLLLVIVLGVEPVASGQPFDTRPILAASLVFFVSSALTLFFHLKLLTRD